MSRAKSKWYRSKKIKKLALDSQVPTVQILTNDVQVLILCLSYFVTTVHSMQGNDYQSQYLLLSLNKSTIDTGLNVYLTNLFIGRF